MTDRRAENSATQFWVANLEKWVTEKRFAL